MNSLVIITGSYLIFVVALIAVVATIFSEKTMRNPIIVLAIFSFLTAFVLSLIAGRIYYDPRPFVIDHSTPLIPHDATNGFPSEHTLCSMTAAVIIFVFKRKTGILLGILAILIGIARVIAGIHHPIDIIGSVIIGIKAGLLGWWGIRLLGKTKVAVKYFERKS